METIKGKHKLGSKIPTTTRGKHEPERKGQIKPYGQIITRTLEQKKNKSNNDDNGNATTYAGFT